MANKEVFLANASDLNDGEMKEFTVEGTRVLLARAGGKFHATSATCPHYGAPLVDGALSGTRVVCPWHHSCFDLATGKLQEPPAFDDLVRFEVVEKSGGVYAQLPDEPGDRATPAMAKRDVSEGKRFVILGGGAAGFMAAQTLREDGFRGRIIVITSENRAPYDRPNLSKEYLQGKAESAWMPLRPDDFYKESDIEFIFNAEVIGIDQSNKLVQLKNREPETFDSILITTGGSPRRLNLPGSNLEGIFLLRSYADADAIIEHAKRARRAVVVGASFIGMEAAASLKTRGLDVTVVAPAGVPFLSTLGPEIGKLFYDVHVKNGIEFRLKTNVLGFHGDDHVEAVIVDGAERIETDMVVMGVGVRPASDILVGLTLEKDGGVDVDEFLCAAPGIYAAGDIASFVDLRTKERTRIEHWRTAEQQGRIAAHNMAGKRTRYESVPFFWTQQFDAGLLYVGHAPKWDEIVFHGTVNDHDFLAWYIASGRVVAVAGMNRDRDMAIIEELFRLDKLPIVNTLRNGPLELGELLKPKGSP